MTISDPERICSLGSCCITICGYANADFMVVLFFCNRCCDRLKPIMPFSNVVIIQKIKMNMKVTFKDHFN